MATLNFTIDEALNIINANVRLPESIKTIKAEPDGLLLTVSGGINILVRQQSFDAGVLELSFASDNWAFKIADSMGKVDSLLDSAISAFPFIRRQNKALFIDLDRALQGRVKGVRVRKLNSAAVGSASSFSPADRVRGVKIGHLSSLHSSLIFFKRWGGKSQIKRILRL